MPIFLFFRIYLFYFLSALVCCCTRAFSGWGGQGRLSSCGVWAYILLMWLLLLWSTGPGP